MVIWSSIREDTVDGTGDSIVIGGRMMKEAHDVQRAMDCQCQSIGGSACLRISCTLNQAGSYHQCPFSEGAKGPGGDEADFWAAVAPRMHKDDVGIFPYWYLAAYISIGYIGPFLTLVYLVDLLSILQVMSPA